MDTVTNKLDNNNVSNVVFINFKNTKRNQWDRFRRYGL